MSLTALKNRRIEQPESGEKTLMCGAHGCPNRWSVEAGNGQLCSYHAWVDPMKWPSITEALRRDGNWSLDQKREVDTSIHKGHPKAWALRLKERHERGEKLTRIQISMYRDALRLERMKEEA